MKNYSILDDGRILYNVSAGFENYSQRNNEFKWSHPKNPKLKMDALSMCNVTSIVMALDYLGWKFPEGDYKQPEDNLCDFIFRSSEVQRFYKEKMPVLYDAFERGDDDAYCPNLIHLVLAYATNQWLGANSAITFEEHAPISKIIKEVLFYKRPVIMSGTFPYKFLNGTEGTIGHINVLVGLIYPKGTTAISPITKPEEFVFDDPYGNWKENFKAGTGNDTTFTYDEFIKYYKGCNDTRHKMAHFVKNGVALI
jgi:hypothetical protein